MEGGPLELVEFNNNIVEVEVHAQNISNLGGEEKDYNREEKERNRGSGRKIGWRE